MNGNFRAFFRLNYLINKYTVVKNTMVILKKKKKTVELKIIHSEGKIN